MKPQYTKLGNRKHFLYSQTKYFRFGGLKQKSRILCSDQCNKTENKFPQNFYGWNYNNNQVQFLVINDLLVRKKEFFWLRGGITFCLVGV